MESLVNKPARKVKSKLIAKYLGQISPEEKEAVRKKMLEMIADKKK